MVFAGYETSRRFQAGLKGPLGSFCTVSERLAESATRPSGNAFPGVRLRKTLIILLSLGRNQDARLIGAGTLVESAG